MIELLFIVIAFILLILVVVWAHFISQNRYANNVDNSFRDETNVRLYKEHKAEIERDYEQGRLDEESYEYLIAELDQSLLQDINENQAEANQAPSKVKSISIVWPISISLFVIVFSAYMYQQNGAYSLIASTPQATQDGHAQLNEQERALVQIEQLKKQTVQEPTNSDAWYGLGQALVGVGDFDGALNAFDQVIAIDGEQADLYGAKAQATFYKNNRQITPDVQQLIDKALSIDPRDPSTNILLGMNQFLNQNFQGAITFWQQVVADNRPSVNVEALKGAIAEAQNRLSLSGGATNDARPIMPNSPQLTIDIDMSDEVLAQLEQGEDKVVFVYAIPTGGARMPLAAVKLMASDLPTRIILNDARAMTPQAKLSSVKAANIVAVISASGSPGVKAGDFKGQVDNVAVMERNPIRLVVDTVIEEQKTN